MKKIEQWSEKRPIIHTVAIGEWSSPRIRVGTVTVNSGLGVGAANRTRLSVPTMGRKKVRSEVVMVTYCTSLPFSFAFSLCLSPLLLLRLLLPASPRPPSPPVACSCSCSCLCSPCSFHSPAPCSVRYSIAAQHRIVLFDKSFAHPMPYARRSSFVVHHSSAISHQPSAISPSLIARKTTRRERSEQTKLAPQFR